MAQKEEVSDAQDYAHLYILHQVPHLNEQPALAEKSDRNLVSKIEKLNTIESANAYFVSLP